MKILLIPICWALKRLAVGAMVIAAIGLLTLAAISIGAAVVWLVSHPVPCVISIAIFIGWLCLDSEGPKPEIIRT